MTGPAFDGGLLVAERIEVTGVVQGVGFRPFVAGLATELDLVGHVGNDAAKVFIEVTGPAVAVERFAVRLRADAPPLARIDRIERTPLDGDRTAVGPGAEAPDAGGRFEIVASRADGGARTLIPPDTATCADCVAELFDAGDRRHRHPFITCTNCGPRFTIVTGLPYDRAATTMASFPMCDACKAEYTDPTDRRHHAQPIACPDCGPTLRFVASSAAESGPEPDLDDPIAAAARALDAGAIVAIRGLGGYHLACRADDDGVLARLRERKHRADKPFAVMVADVAAAEQLATVSDLDAGLLTSGAAPIVLLRARPDAPVSDLVAPGNPLLGVMVAYTPVHHLLLAKVGGPLVMTSANRGGEPLAWTADTLEPLTDLFDAVLDHDRPIHQPCDDSVVRVVGGRLLPVRRARGYAPIPVALPVGSRPVLAVGGELKNTFCVTSAGDRPLAWVSQHLGDMGNLATLQAFEAAIGHHLDLHAIRPEVVAADAHPAYLTSRWARQHHPKHLIEVQHHHAHIAAVMAEHQLDPKRPILGFAFDGTGYGPDGSIWGGEVLDVTVDGYHRTAHLAPVPLPGGDAAIEHPARVALAHLRTAGIGWDDDLAPVTELSPNERNLLARMLERGVNTVPTTSMGRLFDAVASLLDLRHHISYEAQAAIDLEITATDGAAQDAATDGAVQDAATDGAVQDSAASDLGYRFDVLEGIIDPAPVLRALVTDIRAGVPASTAAWRFHRAVVEMIVGLAVADRDRTGRSAVALSGGVFQNALLTERCVAALADHGIEALTHALVPPNDGGLALGQAYIAASRTPEAIEEN